MKNLPALNFLDACIMLINTFCVFFFFFYAKNIPVNIFQPCQDSFTQSFWHSNLDFNLSPE